MTTPGRAGTRLTVRPGQTRRRTYRSHRGCRRREVLQARVPGGAPGRSSHHLPPKATTGAVTATPALLAGPAIPATARHTEARPTEARRRAAAGGAGGSGVSRD